MVFNFLRSGPSGMETVGRTMTAMLADCRHTFDVSMAALEAGEDISALVADVHETDERINAAEEQVRRRLLVHVSVQGSQDVGLVMADLLVVKKLERIGDQHKNILDLAEEGVRLAGAPDQADIQRLRTEISAMFATTATIVEAADAEAAASFAQRATELRHEMEAQIRGMIHSEAPASHAVPRALLYRYLKRIVANLAGVANTVVDGIERIERDADGGDVTDD